MVGRVLLVLGPGPAGPHLEAASSRHPQGAAPGPGKAEAAPGWQALEGEQLRGASFSRHGTLEHCPASPRPVASGSWARTSGLTRPSCRSARSSSCVGTSGSPRPGGGGLRSFPAHPLLSPMDQPVCRELLYSRDHCSARTGQEPWGLAGGGSPGALALTQGHRIGHWGSPPPALISPGSF